MKTIYFYTSKLMLLGVLISSTLGCSSDDGGNTVSPKLPQSISVVEIDQETVTFSYNTENQITELAIANSIQLDYVWENNQIANMTLNVGGAINQFAFSYDTMGHINGLTIDEETFQIEYEPSESTYTIRLSQNNVLQLIVTPDLDVRTISSGTPNFPVPVAIFEHDTEDFGLFHVIPNINLQTTIAMSYSNLGFGSFISILQCAHRPVVRVNEDEIIPFFDGEGLLEGFLVTSDDQEDSRYGIIYQ